LEKFISGQEMYKIVTGEEASRRAAEAAEKNGF